MKGLLAPALAGLAATLLALAATGARGGWLPDGLPVVGAAAAAWLAAALLTRWATLRARPASAWSVWLLPLAPTLGELQVPSGLLPRAALALAAALLFLAAETAAEGARSHGRATSLPARRLQSRALALQSGALALVALLVLELLPRLPALAGERLGASLDARLAPTAAVWLLPLGLALVATAFLPSRSPASPAAEDPPTNPGSEPA